jgi:hypothetical protein
MNPQAIQPAASRLGRVLKIKRWPRKQLPLVGPIRSDSYFRKHILFLKKSIDTLLTGKSGEGPAEVPRRRRGATAETGQILAFHKVLIHNHSQLCRFPENRIC